MAVFLVAFVSVKGRSAQRDVIRTLAVDVLSSQRAWADATAQEQVVMDVQCSFSEPKAMVRNADVCA